MCKIRWKNKGGIYGKKSSLHSRRESQDITEHLENKVSISDLSEHYRIHPNMPYKWNKELFEGAIEIFSNKHKKRTNQQDSKTKALEEKLKKKDSLTAESSLLILSNFLLLSQYLYGLFYLPFKNDKNRLFINFLVLNQKNIDIKAFLFRIPCIRLIFVLFTIQFYLFK